MTSAARQRYVGVLGHPLDDSLDGAEGDDGDDVLVGAREVADGAKGHGEEVGVAVEDAEDGDDELGGRAPNEEADAVARVGDVGERAEGVLEDARLVEVRLHARDERGEAAGRHDARVAAAAPLGDVLADRGEGGDRRGGLDGCVTRDVGERLHAVVRDARLERDGGSGSRSGGGSGGGGGGGVVRARRRLLGGRRGGLGGAGGPELEEEVALRRLALRLGRRALRRVAAAALGRAGPAAHGQEGCVVRLEEGADAGDDAAGLEDVDVGEADREGPEEGDGGLGGGAPDELGVVDGAVARAGEGGEGDPSDAGVEREGADHVGGAREERARYRRDDVGVDAGAHGRDRRRPWRAGHTRRGRQRRRCRSPHTCARGRWATTPSRRPRRAAQR
jgi:hypothetical protein